MLDPVTQQYYLRARFYNPVIGRFTQEDTYYGDGLNLSQYCQANPVGYVDPSGHNCETTQSRYNSNEEQHPKANAADAYQSATEKKSVKKDGSESGTNTTRVGRWMSQDEYNKMVASGKVQMSGDNKVHVANPADINAFGKQAPKGSIYVEFDVPSNTISKGGTDGWGIINGPGSLLDRLNAKKGLPRITEMPNATNITIGEHK